MTMLGCEAELVYPNTDIVMQLFQPMAQARTISDVMQDWPTLMVDAAMSMIEPSSRIFAVLSLIKYTGARPLLTRT
jgi:hypothetical protein